MHGRPLNKTATRYLVFDCRKRLAAVVAGCFRGDLRQLTADWQSISTASSRLRRRCSSSMSHRHSVRCLLGQLENILVIAPGQKSLQQALFQSGRDAFRFSNWQCERLSPRHQVFLCCLIEPALKSKRHTYRERRHETLHPNSVSALGLTFFVCFSALDRLRSGAKPMPMCT